MSISVHVNTLPIYPSDVHKFKREFVFKRYQSAPDSIHLAYLPNHPEEKYTPETLAPSATNTSLAASYPQSYIHCSNGDQSTVGLPNVHNQPDDTTILHKNLLSFSFMPTKSSLHLPTLVTLPTATPSLLSHTIQYLIVCIQFIQD
jgi:hypothetical protein